METRIHKGWRWLIALIVMIGVVFAYRPAMTGFRGWRADQLLEDAREFASQKRWHEVRRTALAASQLAPSIEAARLYFEAHRDHPDILRAAMALALHPDAVGNDHAAALATFLDARDLLNCTNVLRSLSEDERAFPEVSFQIVRLLMALGRVDEAVKLADAAPNQDRSAAFDLLLARQLIEIANNEARADAFHRLDQLLDDPGGNVALDAMRILATQPDDRIDAALARKALDRFKDDIALSVPDQLMLLLLELSAAPDERTALVETAIADHRERHLEHLVPWLLRIGETEKVIEFTDPVDTTARQFQHRANALRVLGRHDQLLSELENPPKGISPVVLNASRAAIAKLAVSHEEDYFWQRALSYAREQRSENQFGAIAQIAGQVGATDRQMEALACGIEHPVGIPPRTDELGEFFAWMSKRDTRRMLAISRRLLLREPGNPVLINNFHYLTTLYGEPGKSTIAALKELVATFPGTIQFRGSLAFAQLKTGHPQAALETLNAANLPVDALPNAVKAVYAAALMALGRKSEADVARQTVDWSALDAGEAEAFKPLLAVGGGDSLKVPAKQPDGQPRRLAVDKL